MFEFDLRKKKKSEATTANEERGKRRLDLARAKLGRHQYLDEKGGYSYEADPAMDLAKSLYKGLSSRNHVPEDNRVSMDARAELTKDREFKMPSRAAEAHVRASTPMASASPRAAATPRVNRKEADAITARLNKESADWTAAHPYQAKKTGGTIKGGFKNSHFMRECRKHKGA